MCTFWRWPHIFCWNQGLSKNPRMWVYRTPHSCSPWRIGIKWGNAPFSGTATQQHQQRWIKMGFQPRGDCCCFFFDCKACHFCLYTEHSSCGYPAELGDRPGSKFWYGENKVTTKRPAHADLRFKLDQTIQSAGSSFSRHSASPKVTTADYFSSHSHRSNPKKNRFKILISHLKSWQCCFIPHQSAGFPHWWNPHFGQACCIAGGPALSEVETALAPAGVWKMVKLYCHPQL